MTDDRLTELRMENDMVALEAQASRVEVEIMRGEIKRLRDQVKNTHLLSAEEHKRLRSAERDVTRLVRRARASKLGWLFMRSSRFRALHERWGE